MRYSPEEQMMKNLTRYKHRAGARERSEREPKKTALAKPRGIFFGDQRV